MINIFTTCYHFLSPSYTKSVILTSNAYIFIFTEQYSTFFFSLRRYDIVEVTLSTVTQKYFASFSTKYVNRNANVSRNLQSMVHIQIMQLILRLFVLYSLHIAPERPGFARTVILMSFFCFETFPLNISGKVVEDTGRRITLVCFEM